MKTYIIESPIGYDLFQHIYFEIGRLLCPVDLPEDAVRCPDMGIRRGLDDREVTIVPRPSVRPTSTDRFARIQCSKKRVAVH